MGPFDILGMHKEAQEAEEVKETEVKEAKEAQEAKGNAPARGASKCKGCPCSSRYAVGPQESREEGATRTSARGSVSREAGVSYVEKNLVAGEKLVYKTGIHWSVLFWPAVVAVLLAGTGVATIVFRRDLYIAGIVLLAAAAVILISAMVKRNATEIAVTNRRVIIKTGLASRRSLEIMLPKVESIGIDEPVMGRMLGYGSVVIRGTGGTPEPFHKIARPGEFRKRVQEQMDAIRQ
jgi:uncharacterized membrane protein YdbT with pleckstrin-like domain